MKRRSAGFLHPWILSKLILMVLSERMISQEAGVQLPETLLAILFLLQRAN
jgi:hypothetical protein